MVNDRGGFPKEYLEVLHYGDEQPIQNQKFLAHPS